LKAAWNRRRESSCTFEKGKVHIERTLHEKDWNPCKGENYYFPSKQGEEPQAHKQKEL